MSRSISVRHSTAASRWGSVAGAVVVLVLALAPVFFVDARCGRSCSSSTCWRWPRRGTCSPGSPGSSRSASRRTSASVPTACWCSPIISARTSSSRSSSPLSWRASWRPDGRARVPVARGLLLHRTWVVAEVYLLLIANTQSLGGGSGETITSAFGIDPTTRLYATYWIASGSPSRRTGRLCVYPHPFRAGPPGRPRS